MKDKYRYETTSEYEMNLVVNRHKLISALEDLKEWHREVLNGKDDGTKILVQGNVVTQDELYSEEIKKRKDLIRDKHGLLIDSRTIYYREDITNKIENILSDVWNMLE